MSEDWPHSREWLESHDYRFESRTRCRGARCRKEIEFYRTPSGRLIPLERVFQGDGNLFTPHHAICPDVNQFRGKPAEERPEKPKPAAEVKPKEEPSPQRRLFR